MRRVLIAGLARSGSTWVGEVFGTVPDCRYIHEPDHPVLHPLSQPALDDVGWYPALLPGQGSVLFEGLWDIAFKGGWPENRPVRWAKGGARRLPRTLRRGGIQALQALVRRRPQHPIVVVKTVRSQLCLDWLDQRYRPIVVLVLAHPLNTLSSWLEIGGSGRRLSIYPPLQTAMAAIAIPPPDESEPERGTARTAWAVCALTTLLLEAQAAHPD